MGIALRHELEVTCTLEARPELSPLVRGIELRERIGRPYVAELEVELPDDPELPAALLGRGGSARVVRGLDTMELAGIVTRVLEAPGRGSERAAILRVEPAWALLRLRRDTRIFQERSVPAILEEVLGPALARHGRSVTLALTRAYPPREMTVQYRETDLDFTARLMEEEGIVALFEVEAGVERLILVDDPTQYLRYQGDDGERIPHAAVAGPGAEWRETILSFQAARRVTSEATHVRGFDWTRPLVGVEARAGSAEALPLDVYDHRAPLTYSGYDGSYSAENSRGQAGLLLERLTRERDEARATSTAIGLRAGQAFELHGHPRSDVDGRWLVVETHHTVGSRAARHAGAPSRCALRAVPADVAWRPLSRHPRPRIAGMQTATVVGPEGEEIHTDPHGRVKVQLHWDRHGARDEHSSCWIRVAQAMGGAGWGFSFIPRIGMEVAITFVEGDPDHPLIVGAVYNAKNPPPYDYPNEKTRTTIKSDSSPGHGGYNELRFEDRAGEEEIYLRAEKDWNTIVLNDLTRAVDRDETQVVQRDRRREVGAKESVRVMGDREKTVLGDQREEVGESRQKQVGRDESITVEGDRTRAVGSDETVFVGKDVTARVGKDDIAEVTGDVTERVGGSVKTTIGKDESSLIGESQSTQVAKSATRKTGGNESFTTGGDRSVRTGTSLKESVDGGVTSTTPSQTETIGASRLVTVLGPDVLNVFGSRTVAIETTCAITRSANEELLVLGEHMELVPDGAWSVTVQPGEDSTLGKTLLYVCNDASALLIADGYVQLVANAGDLTLEGDTVELLGEEGVALGASGELTIQAPTVKIGASGELSLGAGAGDLLLFGDAVLPPGGRTVFYNGVPAIVKGDAVVLGARDPAPGPGVVVGHGTMVMIEGSPAARIGDACAPGAAVPTASAGMAQLTTPENTVETNKTTPVDHDKDGTPDGASFAAVQAQGAGDIAGNRVRGSVRVLDGTAYSVSEVSSTLVSSAFRLNGALANARATITSPGGAVTQGLRGQLGAGNVVGQVFAGANERQGGVFADIGAGFTTASVNYDLGLAFRLDEIPGLGLLADSSAAFPAVQRFLRDTAYKIDLSAGVKAPGSVGLGVKGGGLVDYKTGVGTVTLGGDAAPVVGGVKFDLSVAAGSGRALRPNVITAPSGPRKVFVG